MSYLSTFLGVGTRTLLRKLDERGSTPDGTWCDCGALVYVDNVTIILSDEVQLTFVENAIRRYESFAGAKFNNGKSIGLQPGIWKGKSMLSKRVVER